VTEGADGDQGRRLTLLTHPPTATASRLVFGDLGPLLRPAGPPPTAAGPGPVRCGPEPACRATAAALGPAAEPVAALAGPDLGSWTGRELAEVAGSDPAGLGAWLSDPDARPHGGETLAELVRRLAEELAGCAWPGARSVWVLTPLAARALTVAALAAPPALVLAIDLAYGGEVQLSRHAGRWRLQGLRRHTSPS
jgi:broad specificity phosphatase PhoE